MTFTIQTKQESECKKRKFCIYHHELTLEDLDKYILKIMLEDEQKLNQLFEPNANFDPKKRIKQLQRFIATDFKNREGEIKDPEIKDDINGTKTAEQEEDIQEDTKEDAKKNVKYYSFFAEALMARLNIDFLDNQLVTAVISTKDTIKDVATGADVCMVSDSHLVLGEAKFYSNSTACDSGALRRGVSAIITDESFASKLENYCNKVIDADEIILKGIDGNIKEKPAEEIKKLNFIFTGFVLHNAEKKEKNYNTQYKKIDNIQITNMPEHFEVHLYHLPIKDKWDLVFKAQRKALDLIIELKENKA